MLTQVTNGVEHGLVKSVSNSVKFNLKRFAEKDRESMKKLRDDECKLVTVTYLNLENSLYPLEMMYCDWDGEPLQSWKFIHEHQYTVPAGLVKKINKSGIAVRPNEEFEKSGRITANKSSVKAQHRFVSTTF